MDKQDVIKKIQKCLALSKSANEHEAAAALRQAQKLMELHRVTDADLFIAGVTEASATAGALRKPASWEAGLAAVIGAAFGCAYFFRGLHASGKWVFVGLGPNAEVASYALSVLLRQLRKSRAAFIKSECKRLVPASKTRRADLFCMAWVKAATGKLHALVPREDEAKVIATYLEDRYPSMGELELVNRNANRKLREKDVDAVLAGAAAGSEAQLSRGVGTVAAGPALLG
jgi:hypothetical protein